MAEASKAGVGTETAIDAVFDVFLSYNRADKDAVKSLANQLASRDIKPWLDEWNLVPGEPWQPEIEKVLARCRSAAVLIGPSGMSTWQSEEMRASINRRVRATNALFRVIPVLLPGADPNLIHELPFLAATTWVQFDYSVHNDDALHRLICGIRGVAPGAPIPQPDRRSHYYFILDGTISNFDKTKIEAIVELLRKYSGDATLSMTEITEGSVKLLIEGSQLSFERLDFLYRTGQLQTLLGAEVKNMVETEAVGGTQSSSASKTKSSTGSE